MIVISIVQQKGGVGKTTLAVNLAGELRLRDKRVVLVDTDPQASALAWAAPRQLGFDVRPEVLSSLSLTQWIRNVLKISAEFVIIDTPAGLGSVFRAAVDIADLILIPCGPSSLDLHAARQTLGSIESALRRENRSQVQVFTVPMRVDGQVPEGKQLVEELAGLNDAVAPSLSHDVYYVRAFTQGVCVGKAAPNSSAAHEVRALATFLLKNVSRAT